MRAHRGHEGQQVVQPAFSMASRPAVFPGRSGKRLALNLTKPDAWGPDGETDCHAGWLVAIRSAIDEQKAAQGSWRIAVEPWGG